MGTLWYNVRTHGEGYPQSYGCSGKLKILNCLIVSGYMFFCRRGRNHAYTLAEHKNKKKQYEFYKNNRGHDIINSNIIRKLSEI